MAKGRTSFFFLVILTILFWARDTMPREGEIREKKPPWTLSNPVNGKSSAPLGRRPEISLNVSG
jgi:hypothetical protein